MTATSELRWGALGLTVIILLTAAGNVLVCLAVCWERRLQNMTNYFLMSLAIADLLVSLAVMPFAMLVELYGESTDTQCNATLHYTTQHKLVTQACVNSIVLLCEVYDSR
jgi:hypothetical protein